MAGKDIARHIRQSLGFVCIAALLAPPLAWAGVDPTPFRTGYFGVTAGQAVRVSVLNAGHERGIINPCMSPDPIIATVGIRGLAGEALFDAVAQKVVPSTGTFVDFVPDARAFSATVARTPGGVPPPQSRRLQVRAEVLFSEEDLARVQCSGVALTLEVFDVATGRTAFTLPFAAVMFDPQPDPPEPIAVP